ncbi:MAG: peptidase domain-containing ABC transporter [Myxococcaceae bacterium]
MDESATTSGKAAPTGAARWRGRKARIPFVPQLTGTECGQAALAMVLGFHGKHVSLDDVRAVMSDGRDGSDVVTLLRAGTHFGLTGRAVLVEMEGLEFIERGSILFWQFRHFVVFDGVAANGVSIVDPARGHQRLALGDFGRSFTGLALMFTRTAEFVPQAPGSTRLFRYLPMVLAERRVLGHVVLVSILLQLLALTLPFFTGAIVDRVIPRADSGLLTVLGMGMAMFVAFGALATFLRGQLLLTLQTKLDVRLTSRFLTHLLSLPYAYFQQRASGDLMMRLSSNATVRETLTTGALSTLLDGSLVFVYLLLIVGTAPRLGLLVLGLGAIRVLVFVAIKQRQASLVTRSLEAGAKVHSYQVELLNGIESIKSMGVGDRAAQRWQNLFIDSTNAALARGRLNTVFNSVMGLLTQASPLIVLAAGAHLVVKGELTLGTMLALGALSAGFLGPLTKLVDTTSQLQLLGGYLTRINDVLDAAPEQDRLKVKLAPPVSGAIELEDVSFRYAQTGPLVVDSVSLSIAAGQTVAIVGESGSGKSTLARLLIGLHSPTKGRVRYDAHDLTQLEMNSLRSQLGVVTQTAHIFAGSVRENIALLNPDAPLEAVKLAARSACIDGEIQAMPMAYDTVLSEGGSSLSGGQRQRIALARALLHQPAVLILDEATSALDAITERRIQDKLDAVHCTRVTIAHRLSTIARADLIAVMEKGKIVERGTHAELLSRRGVYARLIAAQRDQEAQ